MSLIDLSHEFDSSVLSRVLAKGRSTGAGFSEVFIEDKRSMGASLDDGLVEQVSSGRDSGAGIRVINGETTGFAYTADLSEAGLMAAAGAAAAGQRIAGRQDDEGDEFPGERSPELQSRWAAVQRGRDLRRVAV